MMHPFAHADAMLRWLLQDDDKVRRRVVYQLMANGLAFGMLYVFSLGGQSASSTALWTEDAPWLPLLTTAFPLAVMASGPFPFLMAYGGTSNLARTASGERLLQVPDFARQLQSKPWVSRFTFVWWIFFSALQMWVGNYDFLMFPLAIIVFPRLLKRLGNLEPDAYPNGQADLDAAVAPPKRHFLGMHAVTFLVLSMATLLGALAGPFGLALLVPLAIGAMSTVHGRIHRGAGVRESLTTPSGQHLLGLRWGSRHRLRWFTGTLATTLPLSLQLAGSTFLLLPAAVLLWRHGLTGLQLGMLTDHATVVLLLALPTIVLTLLANGLSAFTFQVQAIWQAQQVEELQEGQGMVELLERLERAQEAA